MPARPPESLHQTVAAQNRGDRAVGGDAKVATQFANQKLPDLARPQWGFSRLQLRISAYGASPEIAKGRYSPAECTGARKARIEGNPDPKHVSTSFSERSNLTLRMHMRRFTRLTNAFSKKVENHAHAVALHIICYNFVRIHQTLRTTPAMAAGITKRLWEITDIVDVLEAFEASGDYGNSKMTHYRRSRSLQLQTKIGINYKICGRPLAAAMNPDQSKQGRLGFIGALKTFVVVLVRVTASSPHG
jgi:hypothetical protein